MPKGLCSTLKSALRRWCAIRLPRPLLRLALPALATALGALAILAATLQLTPHRSGAPPPSWPTMDAAGPGYLVGHRAPLGRGDATPQVASTRLVVSSRSGVRPTASASPPATSVPSPTPAPSPTPTPEPPFAYVVVEGDRLESLAERFGITPETILWANDLAAGEDLQVGQELTILPVSGVLYTVRAGDTLSAIARTYGAEVEAIVAANGLATPDRLSVGQELVIPGGRPPPATPAPPPATPAPPEAVDAAAASKGEEIAAIAARYLGYAYVYGGTSPATGFDCSGFTQFVYAEAGISIPRGLSGQVAAGPAVARDALMPGDLVFFRNTVRAGLSHVGIYVGGGRMIHASSPGIGVTTDDLGLSYWAARYYGASRPW